MPRLGSFSNYYLENFTSKVIINVADYFKDQIKLSVHLATVMFHGTLCSSNSLILVPG